MKLGAMWRYPVKSMAGERLRRTPIDSSGLFGDRIVQVHDRRGHIVTARKYPRLLQRHATLRSDGEVLVDGVAWNSAQAASLVEAAVAPGARLKRFEGPERFDILPLLVCTDGAVSLFGRDARRLRPNLLIEGVEGTAERAWEGTTLRIGNVVIDVAELRARCVMTTVDPNTGERDAEVLRDIVHRFGGTLCLNARVLRPGVIAEGDEVELLSGRSRHLP